MVFALDGGDGLLGVSAADGFRPHFAQAEAFHLAFTNELLDGSGHIFNGHFGVKTMLIEKFDGIDLQSLQRSFRDPADIFRTAVQLAGLIDSIDDAVTELGRDGDLVPVWGQGLSGEFLIGQRP